MTPGWWKKALVRPFLFRGDWPQAHDGVVERPQWRLERRSQLDGGEKRGNESMTPATKKTFVCAFGHLRRSFFTKMYCASLWNVIRWVKQNLQIRFSGRSSCSISVFGTAHVAARYRCTCKMKKNKFRHLLRPPPRPTPPPTPRPHFPLAYWSRKFAFSRIRKKRVPDGRTDRRTDRPSYSDAWPHLKIQNYALQPMHTRCNGLYSCDGMGGKKSLLGVKSKREGKTWFRMILDSLSETTVLKTNKQHFCLWAVYLDLQSWNRYGEPKSVNAVNGKSIKILGLVLVFGLVLSIHVWWNEAAKVWSEASLS